MLFVSIHYYPKSPVLPTGRRRYLIRLNINYYDYNNIIVVEVVKLPLEGVALVEFLTKTLKFMAVVQLNLNTSLW